VHDPDSCGWPSVMHLGSISGPSRVSEPLASCARFASMAAAQHNALCSLTVTVLTSLLSVLAGTDEMDDSGFLAVRRPDDHPW